MARPIQRKTKKKKVLRKEDTETTINTNMGENQAIQTVKVVIQHPEKPKPRRRKKKDNKKDEAVKELKKELASYDEVQNQAGQTIPAELGISPDEASNLKSTDDILKFIEIIREKKEAIKELQPPPQPQRPPNRFVEIMRPGIIPQVAEQFIPAQIQPQQFIPALPEIRPGIGKRLSELEQAEASVPESLKLKKSESITMFESESQKTLAKIKTILGNVKTAKDANNGVLSQEQLNNFITQLENTGTHLNAKFSQLSPQSQKTQRPGRLELVDSLNQVIRNLRQELRSKNLPLPPAQPKKQTWTPVNNMGLPLVREYVRLDLDVVEITQSQADTLKAAIRGIPEITSSEELIKELETQPDAKKRQNIIKETLQSIKKDKEELKKTAEQEAKDQKKIAEMEKVDEEVDAEKEAEKQLRDKLISYASSKSKLKGFVNWGREIVNALRQFGMPQSEISRIETLPVGKLRKEAVGKFLGLSECDPGRRSGGACYLKPEPTATTASSKPPSQVRFIQTTSAAEYTRLKQQHAGNPNVFVQAPQNQPGTITGTSIEDRIGLGTMFKLPDLTPGGLNDSDLSAGRLGGDTRQVIQAGTWNEYYKLIKLHNNILQI